MTDDTFNKFFDSIDTHTGAINPDQEKKEEVVQEPPKEKDDVDFTGFFDNIVSGPNGSATVKEQIQEAETPQQLENVVEENPEEATQILPDSPLKEEAKQITDDNPKNDEVKNEAVEDFFSDFVKDVDDNKSEDEKKIGAFFDKYNKVIGSRPLQEQQILKNKIDNKLRDHQWGWKNRQYNQDNGLAIDNIQNLEYGGNPAVRDDMIAEASKVLDNPTLHLQRSKNLDLSNPEIREHFRNKFGDEFVQTQDRNRLVKGLQIENRGLAKKIRNGTQPISFAEGEAKGSLVDNIKKGKYLDRLEPQLSMKPTKDGSPYSKKGKKALQAMDELKQNLALEDAVRKNKNFDYSQWWTKDKKQLLRELTGKVEKADSLEELDEVKNALEDEKTFILDNINNDKDDTIIEPTIIENLEDIVEETGISLEEMVDIEQTINNEGVYTGTTPDGTEFEIRAVEGDAPDGERVKEGYEIVPYVSQLPAEYVPHFEKIEKEIEEKEEKIRKKYNLPKLFEHKAAVPITHASGSISGTNTKPAESRHSGGGTRMGQMNYNIPSGGSSVSGSAPNINMKSPEKGNNYVSHATGGNPIPMIEKAENPNISKGGNTVEKKEEKVPGIMGWKTAGAGRINSSQGKTPSIKVNSSGGGSGSKLSKAADKNNITRKSVSQKILSLSSQWEMGEDGWKTSGSKYMPFKFFVKDNNIEVSIVGTGRKRKSIDSCSEEEIQRMAKIVG